MSRTFQCPICGANLLEGDGFCTNCGSKIEWGPQETTNMNDFAPPNAGKGSSSSKLGVLVMVAILLCGAAVAGTIFFVRGLNNKTEGDSMANAIATTEAFIADVTTEAVTTEEVTEATTKETVQEDPDEDALEDEDDDPGEGINSKSGYIIPDSDVEYVSDKKVNKLSIKECNYAANELFARHGRRFQSKELQKYFESKDWYEPLYELGEFDDESVTDDEVEGANFNKLRAREAMLAKKYGVKDDNNQWRYPLDNKKKQKKIKSQGG